jgi:hypothetical protein
VQAALGLAGPGSGVQWLVPDAVVRCCMQPPCFDWDFPL